MKRVKILFLLPSLKAGGAERVISYVAQYLNPSEFDVSLLVAGCKKDQVFKVTGVEIIFLEKKRLLSAIPAILSWIYNIKPNVVLGSIGHVNLLLGFLTYLFPRICFIARETSVMSVRSRFSYRNQLPKWVRKFLYRRLHVIICQSEDMLTDLRREYGVDADKCMVINNPITIQPIQYREFVQHIGVKRTKKLISIGRLSKEKGYERVLGSLAPLSLDFSYLIIGDGPLKSNLKNIVEEMGLSSKVEFLDFTSNVKSYLEESDLYLQGSYVEGFPNALLEAVSTGLPCVVFNAPGGTKEIVRQGFNGFLAKNAKEFETFITEALETSWNPLAISKDAYDRFRGETIVEQYAMVFRSVTTHAKFT
jgi:glycosyltransferase involved in cell wall biosynthesis